jgi:hypothetical protein
MLLGRADGPMTFRLIVQPMVAALIAVRTGFRDASEGHGPYLASVAANPVLRRNLLGQGRKDVGKVFVVAIVLDVIYELMVYRWVYPVQAVVVATVLTVLPYLLIRGPVTRIVRRLRHTNSAVKRDA